MRLSRKPDNAEQFAKAHVKINYIYICNLMYCAFHTAGLQKSMIPELIFCSGNLQVDTFQYSYYLIDKKCGSIKHST